MAMLSWNDEKNDLLKSERGVSFEQAAAEIEARPVLDAEEQEIEDTIDFATALPEAEKLAAVEAFRSASRDTRKAVTMRLAESTIAGLKAKALADGIPYQTLASMVLQKYVRGALLERDAVREVVKALRE